MQLAFGKGSSQRGQSQCSLDGTGSRGHACLCMPLQLAPLPLQDEMSFMAGRAFGT